MGKQPLNSISAYVDELAGRDVLYGGARNILRIPQKTYDEEKKAYVIVGSVPVVVLDMILSEMGLNTQESVKKAFHMPTKDFFEWYAQCEHESLDELKQVPLAIRFCCASQQLGLLRSMVCHSLQTPKDPRQYYDHAKGDYVEKLYELSQQEVQLITTLPQTFVESADFLEDIVVAQKQHPVKLGGKVGLALLQNQGRFTNNLNFFNLPKHIQCFFMFCIRYAFLLAMPGVELFTVPFYVEVFSNFFLVVPACSIIQKSRNGSIEFEDNRSITSNINKIHFMNCAMGGSIHVIYSLIYEIYKSKNFLILDNLKKLKEHCTPTKRDYIIFGVLFGSGMLWDWYKYGVTYDCKSMTAKQLWDSANTKKQTASQRGWCNIL